MVDQITLQPNADGSFTLPDGSIATIVSTIHVDPAPPEEPPPADGQAPTVVGQTLTADKTDIHVGDTFQVASTLIFSDGSTKPGGIYLVGFDKSIVDNGHYWVSTFSAIAEGKTVITNNLKVDGVVSNAKLAVTVLPAVTPPVKAGFTATVDGDTVTINDLTEHAVSESIDYGDGSVDGTLPFEPYTYHGSGDYTIRLRATGADGTVSEATQQVSISVPSDPPVPSPADNLAGKTVSFVYTDATGTVYPQTLNPGDRKRLVEGVIGGSVWYMEDGMCVWLHNRHAGTKNDLAGHFKIAVGDTVVFDGDLTLFAYRGPRPFWLSQPQVRPHADLRWFQSYGAGSEGASMYSDYMAASNGANGKGIAINGIGTTGERAPLGGRLAQYDADYVINPSANNAAVVFGMSDACSPYVMAVIDPETEDWLDPNKYPTACFELVGDKYPDNPIKPYKTASKYNMNGALTHATNYCSLACEIRDTAYDRSMLVGWSLFINSLQGNYTYRSALKCSTYTDAVARAKARGLNVLLYCTRYAPDQWKPLFDSWVREFIQLGEQEWLNQPGIHCDQISGGYFDATGWAPWQDKLMLPEFGLGQKMGYDFQKIIDYFAVILIQMMNLDGANGAQHEFAFIYDAVLFRQPYADEIAATAPYVGPLLDYNDTLKPDYYKPWNNALHAYVKTLDVDALTRRILNQAVNLACKHVWDAESKQDNAAFRAYFSTAITLTSVPVSDWADSLACTALHDKKLAAALLCDESSKELQTAWGNVYPGGQPGDYNGYPTSPTGYPAMGYGAYSAIAEYGTDPRCKDAYEKFKQYLRVNWSGNPKYHEVTDGEAA